MAYISEQGDIILIDFNPQAGHDQQGRRPAYVIVAILSISLLKWL